MPETNRPNRPERGQSPRTIAIIGGGFTGAAVAVHLARHEGNGDTRRRIVVFEPRERLGAGLAYDTGEPSHRINVPAGNMSLYPDDPESFLRYAEAAEATARDPHGRTPSGQLFPQRSLFGAYVAGEAAPYLASGAIEHRRHRVTALTRDGALWRVADDGGEEIVADAVVLAISHPSPALQQVLAGLLGNAGLISEGANAAALETIATNERILIIGNGLTAADVIATLDRQGHRGPILSISRRGLRPRGHASRVQPPYGAFLSPPSTSAAGLLSRIRSAIRDANASGLSWHAVLDAVRQQGQDIWRGLPLSERRRLVRHVRPFWDVHRFRIAPQVEAVIEQALKAGRLTIQAASLRSASHEADGIHVGLKARRGGTFETVVDRIIVTTGPAHGGILRSQAFLRALSDGGLLHLCPSGLGIACDEHSHALTIDGLALDNLLIAGPLARGTFGELMGLPQVSDHALAVAARVETLLTPTYETAAAGSGADIADSQRLAAANTRK